MEFSKIEAITFDCYGTLVDWETGILDGIRKTFPGVERPATEILGLYSEIEPKLHPATIDPIARFCGKFCQNLDGAFNGNRSVLMFWRIDCLAGDRFLIRFSFPL
jgi:hypothetical protein